MENPTGFYGDLEAYDVCWYAIVPMTDPWFDEGDFDEEEYDGLRAKQNARTVSLKK